MRCSLLALTILGVCACAPAGAAEMPGDDADVLGRTDAGTDAGPDPRCPDACSCDARCASDRCEAWAPDGYDAACAMPDVTISIASCGGGLAMYTSELSARVCNRGGAPAPAGLTVRFEADVVLCEATTGAPLAPGTCAEPACSLAAPLDPPSGTTSVRAWLVTALEQCGSPADDACEAPIAIGCE